MLNRAIIIMFALSFACAILLIAWVAFRWNSSETTRAALLRVPGIYWVVGVLIAGCNFLGTIELYRMRRRSFNFYFAALVVAGTYIAATVMRGASLEHALGALGGTLGSLGFFATVWTWYLSRLGLLK